jgi:hypothetical protein
MRFTPERLYLGIGERAYVHLRDDQGEIILMGRKNPFIVFYGHDHKDAKIEYEGEGLLDADSKGLLVTMKSDKPYSILFNHPSLEGSAYLEVNYIPAHNHREVSCGGPAVGSFDLFQI